MDGLALVRLLKADPQICEIPVVAAITAFPEMFSEAAAREASCAAYLVKPINTRALAQQIEAVVATAAARTEGGTSP